MNLNLDKLLQDAHSVGISGHIRPDGDCVGACVGLYLFIRDNYPAADVRLYLDDIPESFNFLKGTNEISHRKDDQIVFDLFFALDCAEEDRMGAYTRYFSESKNTVCIDHHITNSGFAMHNHIKADASSASELICDLIGVDRISRDMAEALYMGIAHDTGVFQYSCTSSHTMELAGALMDKGIDHTSIVQTTFFCRTYLQQQLLGRALLESVPMMDGKVIFSALSLKTMRFCKANSKDLEGIVSLMKNTFGVKVAIFLYELSPMEWKVSLRSSPDVDVASVASAFQGGGHRQAAGCNIQGSRLDVVSNLMPLIARQLEEQN